MMHAVSNMDLLLAEANSAFSRRYNYCKHVVFLDRQLFKLFFAYRHLEVLKWTMNSEYDVSPTKFMQQWFCAYQKLARGLLLCGLLLDRFAGYLPVL